MQGAPVFALTEGNYVKFGGIGSQDSPLLFKNVRIANGGGMTLIEKFAKVGRAVTHGILFEVGKPIDANSTPEGKANNRRMELVKV
jgi:hypothetical protein